MLSGRTKKVSGRSVRAPRRDVHLWLESLEVRSLLSVVTNTNDSGPGSLRQAILDLNANVDINVTFNISTPSVSPFVITLQSPLPAITNSNGTIDASTQPGFTLTPVVQLDNGGGVDYGLRLNPGTTNTFVRGLSFTNFASGGMLIDTSSQNLVVTCFFGLDTAGLAAGNSTAGLVLSNATSNSIGGTSLTDANIISGNNGDGIQVLGTSTGNVFNSNAIGTDPSAIAISPNTGSGIFFGAGAAANTIGGLTTAEGNVIAGNNGDGIRLDGAVNNFVGANLVGVSLITGAPLPNGGNGIYILNNANNNRIGANPGRNIISANGGSGIQIEGSSGNQVVNSYIGTNFGGTVGNAGGYGNANGVVLALGAVGNTIGGINTGEVNLISGNTGSGVVLSANNNVVNGNLIGTNFTGSQALPNTTGVTVSTGATDNTIGSATTVNGNLISGNSGDGIAISGNNTTVIGNFIGTNITGTASIPNVNGIHVLSGTGNSITANAGIPGNLISGNLQSGVVLESGSSGTLISNSRIGTDTTGQSSLANPTSGVFVNGSPSNTLNGNVISGNGNGVNILGVNATGNLLTNNFIGTNITGTAAIQNSLNGVSLSSNASANTIGAGNVISGNALQGISIASPNNVVAGSRIGTDVSGLNAIPNGFNGIQLLPGASGTRIGGVGINEENLISGNTLNGVEIPTVSGSPVQGVQILGNVIGLTLDEAAKLPNQRNGISVDFADNLVIGGTATNAGNLISGNTLSGIRTGNFQPTVVTNVVIQGNVIGTNLSNATGLGNGDRGIQVSSLTSATIGGTSVAARNVISGNTGSGIDLNFCSQIVISGNYIGLGDDGSSVVSNAGSGISQFQSVNVTVGGVASGAGNVISGNADAGISLVGDSVGSPTPAPMTILGNFIGTDSIGVSARPNGTGILLSQTNGALIGSGSGGGNVVSGNSFANVVIGDSANTQVLGNLIGTDAAGTAAIAGAPAGTEGIRILQSSDITIGQATSGRNVISGNTGIGVNVFFSTNVQLVGNYIGVDATGNQALGNQSDGIFSNTCDQLIIGLPGASPNVISGNGGNGINSLDSAGTTIQNNLIGTNASGNAAIGNQLGGVVFATLTVTPSQDIIGGSVAGAGNVISGNVGTGLALSATQAPTLIQGNLIGTNAAGSAALGNGNHGILITGVTAPVTIGGTTSGSRNVISGNSQMGVQVTSSSNVLITGNYVGLNAAGNGALGNGQDGINQRDSLAVTIGGSTAGAGNVISGNANAGLVLTNNIGVQVSQNQIGTNQAGNAAVGNRVGVRIDGLSSTVSLLANLISGNTADGVSVISTTSLSITGNRIGTNLAGTASLGNGSNGILLGSSATGVQIGGTNASVRNIISGNSGSGIQIGNPSGGTAQTRGVLIQGNYIGTDGNGTRSLGNGAAGIQLSGSQQVTIGGSSAGAGNVISGSGGPGIFASTGTNQTILIQGNFVGTNATGDRAIANSAAGIFINTGSAITVGGVTSGAGNLISGNSSRGIDFLGASNSIIQGNKIGTNLAGTVAISNSLGINDTGTANTIGGLGAGAGNLISGNTNEGIQLAVANNTQVLGNLIGTDVNGTSAVSNGGIGVLILGGQGAVLRGNVISGNTGDGIAIRPGFNSTPGAVPGSNPVLIARNAIGTNANGTAAIANGGAGINVAAAANTIGGLTSSDSNTISGNKGVGISLSGTSAAGNLIIGNVIGTNASGTAAISNGESGILVANAPANTIGGTASGAGNLISGNTSSTGVGIGIHIVGSSANFNAKTVILGNRIGTTADGKSALGNAVTGILIENADNNTIGGSATGAGNLISGNGLRQLQAAGLWIESGSKNNVVQGNLIGVNIDGTAALGNGGTGVVINDSPGNIIGGSTTGTRNLISGNGLYGVEIAGSLATGNRVVGNLIGTDINGNQAIPNGTAASSTKASTGEGVYLFSTSANTIGGTATGEGNLISGNLGVGVYILDGSSNNVSGNFIGTNRDGTAGIGNTRDGVLINNSSKNQLTSNLISANGQSGVQITGDGSTGNVLTNNNIGVTATGTPLVNGSFAVANSNKAKGNSIVGGQLTVKEGFVAVRDTNLNAGDPAGITTTDVTITTETTATSATTNVATPITLGKARKTVVKAPKKTKVVKPKVTKPFANRPAKTLQNARLKAGR